MGDMESLHTKLALNGSKIECARTDNVFSPISEVCNGTVSLVKGLRPLANLKSKFFLHFILSDLKILYTEQVSK